MFGSFVSPPQVVHPRNLSDFLGSRNNCLRFQHGFYNLPFGTAHMVEPHHPVPHIQIFDRTVLRAILHIKIQRR